MENVGKNQRVFEWSVATIESVCHCLVNLNPKPNWVSYHPCTLHHLLLSLVATVAAGIGTTGAVKHCLHDQDPPGSLNWGSMAPNSAYFGPNDPG